MTTQAINRLFSASNTAATIGVSGASSVDVASLPDAKPANPFEQRWHIWHAGRVDALDSPHGYLSPVSITWLSSGDTATIERFPGTWYAIGDTLIFAPDGTAERPVTNAGREVTEPISFTARYYGEEDLADLDYGDLRAEVKAQPDAANKDARRFWIRVKDPQSATRRDFHGIPHFGLDHDWVLPAHFTPYEGKRVSEQNSVATSVLQILPVIGTVTFQYEGSDYTLEVADVHGTPTVFFGDATNGHETYGNGRILEFGRANARAIGHIDFNRAYNFPCAFTPYCTCPVPRRENRLPFRVTAGEKTPYEAQR